MFLATWEHAPWILGWEQISTTVKYICMAQKWSTTYDTLGKKVFDPYLLEPLKIPLSHPSVLVGKYK